MIINCEKCASKFNLDENLIRESGSKVRCSVCRSVFTVYPQAAEEVDSDAEHEETVDLDSSLGFEEDSLPNETDPANDDDFDRVFEDALNEEEEIIEEEKPAAKTEPASLKRKTVRPGLILIILVIIFVVTLGALSVYLFAPSLLPEGADNGRKPDAEIEAVDEGNRRLEITDFKWETFSAEKSGPLFIIKGKVINKYPQPRSHILVRGSIEDDKKNPLVQKHAYAGNTFTEKELHKISIEEIDKKLNTKEGFNNSNINVAPMEAIPFMIIFNNLPDSMSEYVSVETVSSAPGE
ncbi:MAG: DUF3426 domain-containing protein [Desulfatiglans sp.]|jgi:predicted Zn finger-like uncharacterized protein|nr:DUF3426 domain-containing protein [Desulfatiglans sp.]